MTVRASDLAAIRRPRILIRAARAGLAGYHRDRDLRRLLRTGRLAPGAALARLIAEERELEHRRRGGEATYALARHVAILTALIAEARNHPPASQPASHTPKGLVQNERSSRRPEHARTTACRAPAAMYELSPV